MAAFPSDSAWPVTPVTSGWELCSTPPGAFATPADEGEWLPAIVPGTAAAALEAVGRWRRDRPEPLHHRDIWYRVRLPGQGRRLLRLGGLATIAEVWLDGRLILNSYSMYLAQEIAVELGGASVLHIVFRSLTAALASRKGPRARWRSALIPEQKLRFARTTLLGHMPGWCPAFDAVGPFRPVELVDEGEERLASSDVRTSYEGEAGRLSVRLAFAGGAPHAEAVLACGGHEIAMQARDGGLAAELALPGVAPWWPHSHGEPALHAAEVRIGERRIDLGRVGFRRIALDRGADGRGFALSVNDVPVFCRGAVWMPPDPVGLGGAREDYAASLALAREAGINMLRVSGTTLYEAKAFHDLCDEHGILVWQDAMLANFDYPAGDDAFAASFRREIEQLLSRLQASPSLAILCGGSEVAQQAAMLGLPPQSWSSRLVDEILPGAVAALRPDTIVVPSSPFGGALPFQADAGCTHYYGVGAYRRPLEDARRADVRFASECLAFSNVPDPAGLAPGLSASPVHDPRWKASVPRDLGAAWDFEDVRDHYLALLYGVDPPRLRGEDPARYLALSRAVVADVMEATIGEWRRPGSRCGGALVWTWQDLRPGAGWGIVDAEGRPKSAWYALRRAFRPLQLIVTDEGVNGLHLHALNEGPEPVAATLSFACLREGRMPVAQVERAIALPARGGASLSAADMLGRFFDANYAYRFGAAEHDVCLATLARDGVVAAQAAFWLPGRRTLRAPLGLTAIPERDEAGWLLRLSCTRMAASVAIDDEAFMPEDNHFDLAPGQERVVRLWHPCAEPKAPPSGAVTAINASETVRYVGLP